MEVLVLILAIAIFLVGICCIAGAICYIVFR
jgi:hypothetical protein